MSAQKLIDANFPVKFKSDLGGDLLVNSMSGNEQMGRLFIYHLELLSEKKDLHFDDAVGKKVTTVLELADGERFFNGFITEFRYAGDREGYTRYQATIRPWFWFLTRTADCRIFQDMTVPDIIKKVFGDHGMVDFEERNLHDHYRKWEYCVQYRESSFNFISRLMEQEGIYYFFEHHANKHILVMVDDNSALKSFPKFEKIPYHHEEGRVLGDFEDHLSSWTAIQSFTSDTYTVQDFNFKTPKLPLLKMSKSETKHAIPFKKDLKEYPEIQPGIYDYPGEYTESENGSNYVKIRLQELQCRKEIVQAGGTSRGLSAGCVFTLTDYPRKDQNKEYLVTSVVHQIDNTSFISDSGSFSELYHCSVEVIDKTIPFRSERETPKPMVQGPQTAIVVGPSRDEIHTNKYGQVKIQFHWDRYGKKDENSSCFVRVSQVWAGARWGGIHIPRIGQEVIVSFMEGDPDRPLITGSVYNASCMPPYKLEKNKTQSGIKSRSTDGGSSDNYNEFRFEDKKGSEEITLHAEKNMSTTIENDLTTVIEHDETRNVVNTRTVTIGTGDNARPSSTIESLQVSGQRDINISGNDFLTVMDAPLGRLVQILDGDYALKVANQDYSLTVDTGNANTNVTTGNIGCTATAGNIALSSPAANTTIDAGSSIVLTVGSNSITIDTGKVELKSPGGTVTLDGGGITISGNVVTSEATGGVNTITGSPDVKIN